MRISDWSSDVCSSDLVLVALVLLLRRDWTAIGWAAATTGALALVSGSLFGFELWPVYVLKTLLFQADLFTEEVTRSFHHMMPTTSAAILLLGYSETAAKFWQAASALIAVAVVRSEEHTSELQSLMRISYAVFCLKKKTYIFINIQTSI